MQQKENLKIEHHIKPMLLTALNKFDSLIQVEQVTGIKVNRIVELRRRYGIKYNKKTKMYEQ
jgi:hypothetical protein